MSKLLEKALKDAVKEKKCTLGAKEVLGSLKDSKLIIVSQSVQKKFSQKIEESAKSAKIPTVQFKGSSVALGRLCGLQFRVSTISITSLTDANIISILNENESEWWKKIFCIADFMKV